MKIAFTTLACPAWSVAEVVAAATRWGYDAIEWRLLDGELIDPTRDRARLGDAVAQCRKAGIEVCALDTSCRFNYPDPAERARQVADLRAWIALAADLAVPLLRVFGGAPPPGSTPSAAASDAWVAAALAEAAPDAAGAGVTILLETHDAYSAARRVVAVLDGAGAPALGALWDIAHPFRVGESASDVLQALGARLGLVHIKDTRQITPEDPHPTQVLLGEGEVPVRAALDALVARGYAGTISVEWEKKWQLAIPAPEVALPQHIAWLRAALGSGQ